MNRIFAYSTSLKLREFLVQCIQEPQTAQHLEELILGDWNVPRDDEEQEDCISDTHLEVITPAIWACDLYSADSDWLQQVSDGNDEPLLCLLLTMCENVTRLSICPPYGSEFLHSGFDHPEILPNVQEVHVSHYDTEGGFSLRRIEPILSLPSLQRMTCHLMEEEDSDVYTPYDSDTKSTLKNLEITYSFVHPEALARFLALCPNLETLTYDDNCITEPATFTSALQSCPTLHTTLKELKISGFQDSIAYHDHSVNGPNNPPCQTITHGTKVSSRAPPLRDDDGGYTFPTSRYFGPFGIFTSLQTLHIQFPQMLRDGPNRVLTREVVSDFFPESIEEVKFVDVVIDEKDGRHEDRLVEVVELLKPGLDRWVRLDIDVVVGEGSRLAEVCGRLGLGLV